MKKIKVYSAKSTAQFDKERVQIYGEELQKIAKKHRGMLASRIVLDEARKENSPLHECFEWDDRVAGEAWRLQQARHLINHIEVEIRSLEQGPKVVRAFVSLIKVGETERNYIDIETVLHDDSLRKVALKQALDDFLNLKKKYGELFELINIFEAIEETQQRLDL